MVGSMFLMYSFWQASTTSFTSLALFMSRVVHSLSTFMNTRVSCGI